LWPDASLAFGWKGDDVRVHRLTVASQDSPEPVRRGGQIGVEQRLPEHADRTLEPSANRPKTATFSKLVLGPRRFSTDIEPENLGSRHTHFKSVLNFGLLCPSPGRHLRRATQVLDQADHADCDERKLPMKYRQNSV